ncbi:exodeoxyribonuclease IX, partial [Stenotrophomonas maltophilia]
QPGLLRQAADPELLGGLCQTLRFGPMTRRRLFDAAGVADPVSTPSFSNSSEPA